MATQQVLSETGNKSRSRNNLILQFNYVLDKKAHYFSLNENGLEDLITQLENLILFKDNSYWLTLARINELALLCAENYANNGELTLADDLLFNPRLTLVHVSGYHKPIVKRRHLSLTEQFSGVAESDQEIDQWLKTKTFSETRTEALLPCLYQKLERSGYFRREYLETLEERKAKIAELTTFLSEKGLGDSLDFFYWIKKAAPADQEFLKSKRCPCTLDLFFDLGLQINELAKGDPASYWFNPANSTRHYRTSFASGIDPSPMNP